MKIYIYFLFGSLFTTTVNIACSGSVSTSVGNLSASETPFPASFATQVPKLANEKIVMPGKSIGPIALGYDLRKAIEILPIKKNNDVITDRGRFTGPNFDVTCPKEYHWISYKPRGRIPRGDYYLYFDDQDTLIQIEAVIKEYRLENGLGIGSKQDEILKTFPDAEKFRVTWGGVPRPGYDELSYLVCKKKGIAFQITSEYDGSDSKVTRIIVFLPDREFVPQGCVAPPASYISF